MKRLVAYFWIGICIVYSLHAQVPGLEAKNWYFGAGTDGIIFDAGNIPYKVSNKYNGVGFEGIVVVNDPLSGALLFYSDGQTVVNSSHAVMFNGTGLFGHSSGAQTVQCVPMPNFPGKFYLLTSRAWDLAGDNLFYSVVDFTDPLYPLGKVTNKNTLLSSAIYGQANKVVSKPSTTDYWWIGHVLNTNTYHIIAITSGGFSAPVTYTATGTAGGDSYTMSHSPITNKVAASGLGTMGLAMMDFNSTTGVLSNPVQIWSVACGLGNFSPDGTKLYFIKDASGYKLHQYDLSNGVTTNMNTCCYAHDTKTGPDGKMYHIHTYSSSVPIAVINNPNMSAVGNACGYNASAPIAGTFNGQVRRFPEFVVMPAMPVLAVTFTHIAAQQSGSGVDLRWSVSDACNACHFVVERGNGRGTYTAVGNLPSSGATEFALADRAAATGHWYYRVKLVDADGKISYSEVVEVGGSVSGLANFELFPNPCQQELHILLDDLRAADVAVEVMDLTGRKVLALHPGQAAFSIDVTSLSRGIYVLKLMANGKTGYRKFEKE